MLRKQHGAAIITAMLFMALVASLAIATAFKAAIATRTSQEVFSLDNLEAADNYALTLATTQLLDVEDDALAETSTNLEQAWPAPIVAEQAGVMIAAQLIDAKSLFNVNSLARVPEKNEALDGFYSPGQIFARLLYGLQVDETLKMNVGLLAKAAVEKLRDGHDPNSSTTIASSLPRLPVTSVTEFRMLPDFPAELYTPLTKQAIALPISEGDSQYAINVNTVEPSVFSALVNLDEETVLSLLADRPYDDLSVMTDKLKNKGLSLKLKEKEDNERYFNPKLWLTTKSDYFILRSVTSQRDNQLVTYRLLHLDLKKQAVDVVWLSRGTL